MFQSTSIDNSNPRQLELSFRFPSEFDFQGFYSNCIFHNFMHLFTARGLSIDIACIFYHLNYLILLLLFFKCMYSTSIIKDITLSVKRTSEWLVLRVRDTVTRHVQILKGSEFYGFHKSCSCSCFVFVPFISPHVTIISFSFLCSSPLDPRIDSTGADLFI